MRVRACEFDWTPGGGQTRGVNQHTQSGRLGQNQARTAFEEGIESRALGMEMA